MPRHHDPQHFRLILRARAVIDSQRCARQTKHHDREEARLITAGDADDRFTGFDRLLAAEEVRDIVDAGHVEPEHRVQCVVQADRDQQTVEEGIDARADGAQFLDVFAEAHQSAEHHWPDEHQDVSNGIIRKEMRIGTGRRPLKNDSALGSSTPLKRLYTSAEMIPTRIPTNWFSILPNAAGT